MTPAPAPENQSKPSQTLIVLFTAYTEGTATPAQVAELERLIATDPAMRKQYLACTLIRATLIVHTRTAKPAPTKPTPLKPEDALVPGRQSAIGNRQSAIRWSLYTLAAILLVAAYSAVVYFHNADTQPVAPAQPGPPVATLIQNTGDLRTPHGYPAEGDDFSAGEYTLTSGTAEFMLTNAVNVKFRGDTRMHMRNPMNVAIARGSADFVVPRDAAGFTVHLPDRSSVVDLGTKFSVETDDRGRTRVRVTQGKVLWKPLAQQDPAHAAVDPVLVTAPQAATLVDGVLVIVADSQHTIFYDSFESPRVVSNGQTDPTGWASPENAGGINREKTGSFDTPFGDQVAWLNTRDMTTTPAILDRKLEANTKYTLTLNVGRRADIGPEFDPKRTNAYTAQLLAGNNVIASASGNATKSDFSETVRVAFTANETHAELIGKALAIRLGGTIQAQFDNVRLTAKPSPISASELNSAGRATTADVPRPEK